MKKAIFPGSFNPIHNGHEQIIIEAAKDYDHLYVFVANNENKTYARTLKFRTELVQKVVDNLGLANVTVIQQQPGTLTPNIANELGAEYVVRGLKTKVPTPDETSLAEAYLDKNNKLAFQYYVLRDIKVSSTEVNQNIKEHQIIAHMVPSVVEKDILIGRTEDASPITKRGKLVIFCGPSGSGKGTVEKHFIHDPMFDFHFSVSATTRPMREGEKDGVNYHFVSKYEFEKMIKDDEFYEWAEFAGNYYGTPIAPVIKELNNGFNVFLEIEYQGVEQLVKKAPEAVTIFLAPPSIEELERRLRARDTESEAAIQKRVEVAKYELTLADNKELFKYKVINEDVDTAVKEIVDILRSELDV